MVVYSEFHGILTCTLVIRSDTTKVRSGANLISQGSCHGSSWLFTLHQPMMTNPIHNNVDTPGLYEISNQDPFYDQADRVAEYSYIAASNKIVWRCHARPVLKLESHPTVSTCRSRVRVGKQHWLCSLFLSVAELDAKYTYIQQSPLPSCRHCPMHE